MKPGKKGFIVLNTENGSRRFVRAALRECAYVSCALDKEDTEGDILNKIHQSLQDVPEENLVYLHLEGSAKEEEFNPASLQKMLLQEYFGVRIDTSDLTLLGRGQQLNTPHAAPAEEDEDATRIWNPQEESALAADADDWTREERPLSRKMTEQEEVEPDAGSQIALREIYRELVRDAGLAPQTADEVLKAGFAALDGEELPL
jgi:hypothetical protein